MKRLFISYRRRDTAREAHVLKSMLESRLEDVRVFVDTENIPPGATWPERLEREVRESAAIVALIGPDWRSSTEGADRLADPDDWVRRELELALEQEAGRLLPVIVEDALDQLDDLPDSLTALTTLQSVDLGTERWEDDVRRIARWAATTLHADEAISGAPWPPPDEIKQMFPPLADDELDRMLESGGLSGWIARHTVVPGPPETEGHELYKVFEFANFKQAFTFMHLVALRAEQFNHHPDWSNAWNKVRVSQRTFDAGHVITTLDLQLAAYMNQAAAQCRAAAPPNWPPGAPA